MAICPQIMDNIPLMKNWNPCTGVKPRRRSVILVYLISLGSSLIGCLSREVRKCLSCLPLPNTAVKWTARTASTYAANQHSPKPILKSNYPNKLKRRQSSAYKALNTSDATAAAHNDQQILKEMQQQLVQAPRLALGKTQHNHEQ